MKSVVLALLVMIDPTLALARARGDGRTAATQESGSTVDDIEINVVRKMEADRLQAGVRKDVEAISLATADDYIQIDSDGRVLDKAATLQRIRSSYARLQANPVDDMVVRIYGTTAVVTARANPEGTINGKPTPPIRYTRVYVKRGGRWRVVLFQQTRVAEAN